MYVAESELHFNVPILVSAKEESSKLITLPPNVISLRFLSPLKHVEPTVITGDEPDPEIVTVSSDEKDVNEDSLVFMIFPVIDNVVAWLYWETSSILTTSPSIVNVFVLSSYLREIR